MRQRRWLELIKYYDLTINYTTRKDNVVANALSRKATCNMLVGRELPQELHKEIDQTQLELWKGKSIGTIEAMRAMGEMSVNLREEIISRQEEDPFLVEEI
jgi:hypothetical protein